MASVVVRYFVGTAWNGRNCTNQDSAYKIKENAINRAKTFYFTNRWCFDEMVQRNMAKDVSWEKSAKQYKDLYEELCWL